MCQALDIDQAALLAKSDEQARQLQESETALLKATGQLEDLRRAVAKRGAAAAPTNARSDPRRHVSLVEEPRCLTAVNACV